MKNGVTHKIKVCQFLQKTGKEGTMEKNEAIKAWLELYKDWKWECMQCEKLNGTHNRTQKAVKVNRFFTHPEETGKENATVFHINFWVPLKCIKDEGAERIMVPCLFIKQAMEKELNNIK